MFTFFYKSREIPEANDFVPQFPGLALLLEDFKHIIMMEEVLFNSLSISPSPPPLLPLPAFPLPSSSLFYQRESLG